MLSVISEVIIQTEKYQISFHNSSSGKIRSPEQRLKLDRWQGPPHINKLKQYETVSSYVNEEVFSLSMFWHETNQPMKTQKLQSAPLNLKKKRERRKVNYLEYVKTICDHL